MRFLLLAIILLFPNFATAQRRPSAHLILARMCSHEASLPVHIGDRWVRNNRHDVDWGTDCWIIHTVILREAHRLQRSHPDISLQRLYVTAAVNYSHGRILHPPATDGNRWASDLHSDGRRPVGWHGLPWSHMRPSWLHVYEVTAQIVRTPLEVMDGPQSPLHCDGLVTDWGGVMDREHARSIGLIEVHCAGEPANIPYRTP
jgi:hypothetical protein